MVHTLHPQRSDLREVVHTLLPPSDPRHGPKSRLPPHHDGTPTGTSELTPSTEDYSRTPTVAGTSWGFGPGPWGRKIGVNLPQTTDPVLRSEREEGSVVSWIEMSTKESTLPCVDRRVRVSNKGDREFTLDPDSSPVLSSDVSETCTWKTLLVPLSVKTRLPPRLVGGPSYPNRVGGPDTTLSRYVSK